MTNPYLVLPQAHVSSKDLTAIDLFSGAGGITLGLLNAGFDVLLSSDISTACAKTHARNFNDVAFTQEDIHHLSNQRIKQVTGLTRGDLDVLFGGPPCQGFSIIGARDGDDPRNGLFREFMRVAKALAPKVVVIENVPGLATLNKGNVLAEVGLAFRDAGYTVTGAELVAAQYGVPQMRWRFFFIGWRNDLGIRYAGFPQPTHGISGIGDLLPNRTITDEEQAGFLRTADAIGDLPSIGPGDTGTEYIGCPARDYQKAMRWGLTSELWNHYAPALSEQNLCRIRSLLPGQDWRDLPFELLPDGMKRALRKDHTRRYRRMKWDGVPRSIITRFRDPKSGEYTHPEQHRTISIREAARIQSFPDWFKFEGTNSEQYDQVGNAVPVLLAKAVASELADVLQGQVVVRHQPPKSRYFVGSGVQTSLFADSP